METLEELVQKFLAESPSAFPKISEDALSSIYAMGYNFYTHGKYQESSDFFRFLTIANPYQRKHWMGLAASKQMLKQYPEAIECYSVAAVQDPHDPYTHLYAADCFLALNDHANAKIALESAEKTARKNSKEAHLIPHINLILKEGIEKKQETQNV